MASVARNITLFAWIKIFNKRVYLPLTAIYLVEVGRVTLPELGIIAVLAGLTSLVAQIPTGYFADRTTRKFSMIIGAVLLCIGTIILTFMSSFVGGAISAVLMSAGFSFMGGAGTALIHDSLEQLGRNRDYLKVMGRIQSKGLIGNIILVGVVPLTYGIHQQLPFVLGVMAYFALLVMVLLLVEPVREHHTVVGRNPLSRLIVSLRTFVFRRTFLLFFTLGLLSAIYLSSTDFNTLIFKDLGMSPHLLGIVYAGTSLLGAICGYFLHYAHKLSFQAYVAIDVIICSGFFMIVGLSQNLWVMTFAFLINLGLWRLRNIMHQRYLFDIFKGTKHKATLISTVSFFEQLHHLWVPSVFVVLITQFGYYAGYIWLGSLVLIFLSILFSVAFKQLAAFQAAKANTA